MRRLALLTSALLLLTPTACTDDGGNEDGSSEGETSGGDDADTTGSETGTDTGSGTGTDTDTDTDTGTTTDTTTTTTTTGMDTDTTADTGTDTGGMLECDPLGVCESEPASDGFDLIGASITDDCLELELGYSGGCEEHLFSSCWDMSFAESDPVQVWLWVDHDAMGDACEAYIQTTYAIDLTTMKEAWQDAYQSQSGTILINLDGQQIQYDF